MATFARSMNTSSERRLYCRRRRFSLLIGMSRNERCVGKNILGGRREHRAPLGKRCRGLKVVGFLRRRRRHLCVPPSPWSTSFLPVPPGLRCANAVPAKAPVPHPRRRCVNPDTGRVLACSAGRDKRVDEPVTRNRLVLREIWHRGNARRQPLLACGRPAALQAERPRLVQPR